MPYSIFASAATSGRTPPGVRGLKYAKAEFGYNGDGVAPHPGCVD